MTDLVKTAKKSAGRPFVKGADPRRGCGKKGRSGRKPLAFVERCEAATDGPLIEKVERHLARNGPKDAAWRWCAEYVSKYTKAEPKKSVEVTGKDGAPLETSVVNVYVPDNGRDAVHTNGNGRKRIAIPRAR